MQGADSRLLSPDIAGDRGDFRMRFEPFRKALGSSVRQKIQHAVQVQVDRLLFLVDVVDLELCFLLPALLELFDNNLGLAIAATLEVTGFRLTSFVGFLALGFVYVAGLLCWHSLKRYRAIMGQAERLSEQSTCKACRTYAAFSITAEHPRMSVRCRKCAHEWTFR